MKIRYLLTVPQKYDAYCFGSSRVGNIDLTKINDGHSYYNMTYSAGVPEEWLHDLQILLRHNVSVKKVLLGIDDFSFRENPKAHESQTLRLPYRDDGNFRTYISVLLKQPSLTPFVSDKSSIFDIYGTGRPLHDAPDIKIEQDVAAHINDSKFSIPSHASGYYLKETIDALNSIKELCAERDIELIVFFNPIHKTTYLYNNLDELNEFKSQLANITAYYDFSGLNKITTSLQLLSSIIPALDHITQYAKNFG